MNDKMTDAELSKILGRYQAAESIGIFLGALCVIAGTDWPRQSGVRRRTLCRFGWQLFFSCWQRRGSS